MKRHSEPAVKSRADVLEGVTGRLQAAAEAASRKSRALGRPVLAWASARIPQVDLLDVFERSGPVSGDRILWMRPDEPSGMVGVGAAWACTTGGPTRFSQAGAAWRSCLAETVGDDADQPGPVALCGFSFAPDGPTGEEWDGYPAGAAVLPRLTISTVGDASRLVLAVMVGPEGVPPDADAEITAGLRVIADASNAESDLRDPVMIRKPTIREPAIKEVPSAEDWKAAVRRAALTVRQGSLRKIVLARQIRVRGAHSDRASLLRRLRADYPGCTVFAVARRDRCFLGATPERLVRVRDGNVGAMAVAGSAPRGTTEAEDRRLGEMLLASAKDRLEHAIVVDALRSIFAEVCANVQPGTRPALLKVRNVQHLLTPLIGRLRDHLCVLDLVERLHPTPATGGFPRADALRWIREHEGLERGWYAGPIGWIDRAGEGEFVVAIRSALLRGDEVLLFAGCGIVADSDPDQEYAESRLKLRPVLSAMGISALGDS